MVVPLSKSITPEMALYRLALRELSEKNSATLHKWMYVLSFCLEQKSCTALDKVPTGMWGIRIIKELLSRISIICVLRLALIS